MAKRRIAMLIALASLAARRSGDREHRSPSSPTKEGQDRCCVVRNRYDGPGGMRRSVMESARARND
jgi:hypothetical protein